VDLSRARASLGDHRGAVQALDRAVALEPGSYWHHIDRGRELIRVRRWEEAQEDFSKAILIDPDKFLAYAYRAGVNEERGRIEAAVGDYETVLRLRPDYEFAHASLGVLYFLSGRWDQAAAELRRARELEPGEEAWALLRALSLKRAGRAEEAVQYLNDLATTLPRESWAYDIARYLADPARESHAVAEAERDRDATPRRRRLFYLGMELLAAGRLRTALAYLSEAARLPQQGFPERRIAEHLLKQYGVEGE
jgi:tetratricopeptide (TPR) repeat protein